MTTETEQDKPSSRVDTIKRKTLILLAELWKSLRTFWKYCLLWAAAAWSAARQRYLAWRLSQAKIQLAEAMWVADIGDESTRKLISDLDKEIATAKAEKRGTRSLQRDRRLHLVRLLEDVPDPAPAAVAGEVQRVSEIELNITQLDSRATDASALLPVSGIEWRRLAVGMLSCCTFLILSVSVLSTDDKPVTRTSKSSGDNTHFEGVSPDDPRLIANRRYRTDELAGKHSFALVVQEAMVITREPFVAKDGTTEILDFDVMLTVYEGRNLVAPTWRGLSLVPNVTNIESCRHGLSFVNMSIARGNQSGQMLWNNENRRKLIASFSVVDWTDFAIVCDSSDAADSLERSFRRRSVEFQWLAEPRLVRVEDPAVIQPGESASYNYDTIRLDTDMEAIRYRYDMDVIDAVLVDAKTKAAIPGVRVIPANRVRQLECLGVAEAVEPQIRDLLAGDIILSVAGQTVSSTEQLASVFESQERASSCTMRVYSQSRGETRSYEVDPHRPLGIVVRNAYRLPSKSVARRFGQMARPQISTNRVERRDLHSDTRSMIADNRATENAARLLLGLLMYSLGAQRQEQDSYPNHPQTVEVVPQLAPGHTPTGQNRPFHRPRYSQSAVPQSPVFTTQQSSANQWGSAIYPNQLGGFDYNFGGGQAGSMYRNQVGGLQWNLGQENGTMLPNQLGGFDLRMNKETGTMLPDQLGGFRVRVGGMDGAVRPNQLGGYDFNFGGRVGTMGHNQLGGYNFSFSN